MSESRLLRGTVILSAAVFFSKFLGLIFVIPFEALVGPTGLALYGYAYTPYTIILSIATMGVPMAISKFVSKYNALGDYRTGRRLFKSGLLLMSLTGFIAFLLLFFLAPAIAPYVVHDAAKGNDPEDVVLVIRLVSTALIVVPVMSVIRGYFQGFQSMGPTAASQVVEQIVRIGFILVGASLVIYAFNGSVTTAVGFATFAAFVGALGGLAVLLRYWKKRKPGLDRQLAQSRQDSNIPYANMYRELITYAVPFVVVGLAIPLYLLVDEFTVNRTITSISGFTLKEAERIFANINQAVQKLIMIPVSLSTALAVTLVPAITNSFTSGNYRRLHNQMTQAFQIVLFLTIPAAVGLSVLAYAIYGTLYGIGEYNIADVALGGKILRWYAPTALLFALFSITASILQGINQQKFTIFSLLVGLLMKLLLNQWLLRASPELGAVFATDIGFICSVTLNLIVIRTYVSYRLGFVFKRGLLILIFSALMAIVVWLATMPIRGGGTVPDSYAEAIFIMIPGVLVGGAFYFLLVYRSNLAGQILGDRFSVLKRKKGESK
ncbi:MAG TPA: polysaccharide biosynthesis protein [Bacillales bacterium]|nr:polysaccharide biosynthesis protein [Bacillales bacterium]